MAYLELSTANPKPSPYNYNTDLSPPQDSEDTAPVKQENYRAIVGELRFLADCTRPDIAFLTASLARALSRPTQRH